jgi:PAS domain S-box-containing protein
MNEHTQILGAILDSSLDGIVALSKSIEKPYASSAYSALFPGWENLRYYGPLDILRDFYARFITNVDDLVALIAEVRRTRERREGRVHLHDGRVLQVVGKIIKTPDGAETEVRIFRDITEKCRQDEQLQLRLQLVTAILNASNDAIIALVEGLEKPLVNTNYSALFPDWQEALRYGQPLKELEEFYARYVVDWKEHLDLVDSVRRTKQYQQVVLHHRDGRILQKSGELVDAGLTRHGALEIYTLRDITTQCRQDEQLQLRLQLVTAVLNASNDAIFTVVEGLEAPMANTSYTSLFPGWENALRYGQPLKELEEFFKRYLVDWEAHVDLVDKVRRTKQYHQTIIHHKDGRIIDISGKMVNASFIRHGAMEIYTLRDITEEVRGGQKMRAMQLMVDNLSDPVAWSDLKGHITYVNQAMCTALGYDDPAEMLGKSIWRFFSARSFYNGAFAPVGAVFAKLRKETHCKFDHASLSRKNGTLMQCMATIDHITEGSEPFLAMCFHDLSEQIQRLEAERTSEAKTKFLAKMSHEIRTPLNSIIGMAEITMRKIHANEAYREIHEFVTIIQQSGLSLLAIVNDILDFSKIESGSLQLNESRYSFASLLNDVINIASVQIVEHKAIDFIVRADADIPHELFGDEVRVRQIFVNLLSNAIKYTLSGHITLDVKLEERSGDAVTLALTVKDTGIGIREKDLQTIFEEFKRADSAFNQKTEGTGLGLAIVKNLCGLMHGEIKIASLYGSGSEFTAVIRQKAGSPPKLASVATPEQKRVLLLKEQNPQYASLVSALRDLGLPEPKTVETLPDFLREFASGVHNYAFLPLWHVRAYSPSRESPSLETCLETSPWTKLVVMAQLGDIADMPGAIGMTMPVYCVPLANILNDVNSPESRTRDEEGHSLFSAPAAAVLVVDDVPTNLRVAKEFLNYYGIAAETCADGAEALAMVQGKRYDLILMDHMMPKMNGLEATLRIRRLGGEDEYFRTVPIVALTANAVAGQKEIFLQHGFSDFLSKPVKSPALDAVLRKWLPLEKQQTSARTAPDGRAAEPALKTGLVDGLDLAKGIQNVGGRKAAYANILSLFRQDCATLRQGLSAALAAGDYPAYTIAAHALKGSLRTIGAGQLAISAMRLEKAAANEDAAFLQENTQPFLNDLRTLTDAFDQVLPGLTGRAEGGNAAAGNEELPRKLEALRRALISMDVRVVNDLLTECLGLELSTGQRALFDEIDMLVMAFEFEKAVASIQEFSAANAQKPG